MNDRFKFRVWDNSHNQYYDISKYNVVPCLTTLGLKWYDKGSGMLSTDLELWGKSQENRFIIEQCTGLKDKNGKLIYEGDILNCANGSINGIIMFDTMVVEWLGFKFCPSYFTNIKGEDCSDSTHWVEIIGNIHENKDLLDD